MDFWKKPPNLSLSCEVRKVEREINPRSSRWSSPAVPNSGWCSVNFLLGAGMVLIQKSTQKIVVIYESSRGYWFLPRGRKDLGESLEAAALREAFEETGYRAEFMPIDNPSRAPAPPGKESMYHEPNTEPFYVTTRTIFRKDYTKSDTIQSPDSNLSQCQYFTSWYIGQIPDGANPERGTGMADEKNYVSHLLTYEEALAKVWGQERDVLEFAWAVFLRTTDKAARAKPVAAQGGDREDPA